MRLIFTGIAIAAVFLFAFNVNATKHEGNEGRKAENSAKTNPSTPAPLSARLQRRQHRLDSVFAGLYKQRIFNGCAAVSYHDTLLYRNALGFENYKSKKELSNESVFQLASVSKVFTAVAVQKLQEQGKLDIKDKFEQYFPNFPYKNISIEQLLSHTSGLPNYLYFYYHLPKAGVDTLSNQRVFDLMCTHKPAAYFRPGRRFQYNNTNYVLLALLVEKLSGQTFPEYVQHEIFDVCGMKNTTFFNPADTFDNQAVAFTYRGRPVGVDIFDYVYGDKGVCSTTEDMMLFSRNLFSGKIIKDVQNATKPRVRTGYGRYYALGLRVNPNRGDTIFFHNGWWHGYRSAFQYRKSDKTTLVILSNRLDKSVYQTTSVFNAIDNKKGIASDEEDD